MSVMKELQRNEGKKFENNPFLYMVPYENEDIMNTVNYLQVYFLVYS